MLKNINISKVESKNRLATFNAPCIYDTRKKNTEKAEARKARSFFQCATGGNVSSLRNVVSVPRKVSRDTLQSERLS